MSKRKSGEGSYFTKTINGYEYRCFKFPDNHVVYAKKPKELEEKKKEYIAKKKSGVPTKTTPYNLEQYCTKWLKTRRGYISDRLYDDYESIIKSRIKPNVIGQTNIQALDEQKISSFLMSLADKYAKATIDKTWVVIKQTLIYGHDEGDIREFNLRKINKPNETKVAVKKKKVPFISQEDMKLLEEEALRKPSSYGLGAYVLVFIMYSGLRISEATGLQWKYVDDDLSNIHIYQTASKIVERDDDLNPIHNADGTLKYKNVLKGTKTEDSQRTIPMSNKCQEILAFFKKRSSKNGFVFVNSHGNRFSPRTLERTLTTILENSSCSRKDYTPHCLRHGFGSVLIQNGVDIKVVSELLGHSDIRTTYDIYIGVSDNDKKNAIDIFN